MSTDVMLIGSVVHNTGTRLVSVKAAHGTRKIYSKRVRYIYLTSI